MSPGLLSRIFAAVFAACSSLPPAVTAQTEIDCLMQVYRMEPGMADALQKRLLAGGDSATGAVAKLPDFIRQRRVTLEDEIRIPVRSGTPTKQASSDRKLEVEEDWHVADGLETELDLVVIADRSLVDFNFNPQYARQSKRGVMIRALYSSATARTGVPLLLARWQRDEDALMLLGTATVEAPSPDTPQALRQAYLDVTFFRSQADAETGRNPVARATLVARSGQRAKTESYVRLTYESGKTQDFTPVGLEVEIAPVIHKDKTCAVSLSLEYSERAGGTQRLANGDRLPRMEIHRANPKLQLEDGQTATVDLTLFDLVGATGKADPWKATVTYQLYEIP